MAPKSKAPPPRRPSQAAKKTKKAAPSTTTAKARAPKAKAAAKAAAMYALPSPLRAQSDLARADAAVRRHQQQGETTIVLVYSPMCGHCAAMRDEWSRAAARIASAGIPVVDMDVQHTYDNADMFLPTAASQGLGGVPHLVALNGSRVVGAFEGPRTEANIVRWATHARSA